MKKLRVTVEGKTYEVEVELIEEDENDSFIAAPAVNNQVSMNAPVAAPAITKKKAVVTEGSGEVLAPMAGNILTVDVKVGDTVNRGDNVATMEAMKMETPIKANKSGKITDIKVKAGENIDQGSVIVVIG